MSEQKEHFEIDATEGDKSGIVALLDAALQTAEKLPEDRHYDVLIEVEEHNND